MVSDVFSRLTFRQLGLVAAVVEHGQLSLAADQLGVTQPAASRTLADMERILGVPLFERRTRGMVPTDMGRTFARRAANVLREMGAGLEEVSQIADGLSGTVAVGAVTGAAVGYLVPAIRAFRDEAPGVEVEIETGMSDELVRGLLSGQFDLVMARLPAALDPRGFEMVTAAEEQVAFICRAGHPLLDLSETALADLASYDWVMQRRGAPIRVTVETALRAAGTAMPRHVTVSQSLLVTLAALRGSDMVAPVAAETADVVIDGIGARDLGRIVLKETLSVPPYSIITLRDRTPGPAASRFLALLRGRLGAADGSVAA